MADRLLGFLTQFFPNKMEHLTIKGHDVVFNVTAAMKMRCVGNFHPE
jgi:hypothetical protein